MYRRDGGKQEARRPHSSIGKVVLPQADALIFLHNEVVCVFPEVPFPYALLLLMLPLHELYWLSKAMSSVDLSTKGSSMGVRAGGSVADKVT
jgi:hypothetical protein